MGHPDGPKQFIRVREKPIIAWTLEIFQQHPKIDAIYLVSIKEKIELMKRIVEEFQIHKVRAIVPGGKSAQESIFCGLTAAKNDHENDENTIALIHDGVRPIISAKLINENIESVAKCGSAISAIPAFETIARSAHGGGADRQCRKSQFDVCFTGAAKFSLV